MRNAQQSQQAVQPQPHIQARNESTEECSNDEKSDAMAESRLSVIAQAPIVAPSPSTDVHGGHDVAPAANANGDLDFIGTSPAVKSLFSLPYSSNKPLSIAIHNVDGMLLVDDASTARYDLAHAAAATNKAKASGQQQRRRHLHNEDPHQERSTPTIALDEHDRMSDDGDDDDDDDDSRDGDGGSAEPASVEGLASSDETTQQSFPAASTDEAPAEVGRIQHSLALALSKTTDASNWNNTSEALTILNNFIAHVQQERRRASSRSHSPFHLSSSTMASTPSSSTPSSPLSSSSPVFAERGQILLDKVNWTLSETSLMGGAPSSTSSYEYASTAAGRGNSPTTASSHAVSIPPNPREYVQWKFRDMNLLVGSDAMIVRQPMSSSSSSSSSSSTPSTSSPSSSSSTPSSSSTSNAPNQSSASTSSSSSMPSAPSSPIGLSHPFGPSRSSQPGYGHPNLHTTHAPSETTALAIRVEDVNDLRQLFERHQERVAQKLYIPDHQVPPLAQRGKPSYAQAVADQLHHAPIMGNRASSATAVLAQKRNAHLTRTNKKGHDENRFHNKQQQQQHQQRDGGDRSIDDDSKDDGEHPDADAVETFSAPNLDKVRLQTCIVPSSGPLGGLLQNEPSGFDGTAASAMVGGMQLSDQPGNDSSMAGFHNAMGVAGGTSPASQPTPLSIVLDAYLDNLMANVPQLALCLREKGFIQSVKLMQTNDIPSMLMNSDTLQTDSKYPISSVKRGRPSQVTSNRQDGTDADEIFSPQIMEMNASALLRFLKANCTKNNATYLLSRDAGQTNIQLYDISSISTQRQKKWVWWLATMSYRFALRLRHLESMMEDGPDHMPASSPSSPSVSPSASMPSSASQFDKSFLNSKRRSFRDRQRSLLQTTLDLLDDLKDMDGKAHESLVASVYEHLSETYLGGEVDSANINESSKSGTARRSSSNLRGEGKDGDVRASSKSASSQPSSMPRPVMSFSEEAKRRPPRSHTQPYAHITIDSLTKSQDYLVRGIKILWPVLEKVSKVAVEQMERRKQRRLKRSRRHAENASSISSRPQTVTARMSGDDDDDDEDEEDCSNESSNDSDGFGNPNRIPEQFMEMNEAVNMQLFGLHYKLINVTLRLAEHHLRNYFSSSAMQALRLAGHRISTSASIVSLLYMGREKEEMQSSQLFQSLQLQYCWLWEHCGHFARSFASDELWRDRGHASGDDVIYVLQDVKESFENQQGNSVAQILNLRPPSFHSQCRRTILDRSHQCVSFNSLSGVVDIVFDFGKTKKASREAAGELTGIGKDAVAAAESALSKQRLLDREKRKVLVASCIAYDRAIRTFEDMVAAEGMEDTGAGVHTSTSTSAPPAPSSSLSSSLQSPSPSKASSQKHTSTSKTTTTTTKSSGRPDEPSILNLLRQRMGDACNETGKMMLSALRALLASPSTTATSRTAATGQSSPEYVALAAEGLLCSARFWFLEGLHAFGACGDLQNVALLRCNLCQCYKLRANSRFATNSTSASSSSTTTAAPATTASASPPASAPDGTTHAEKCLQEAADHLQAAHESLGVRDVDPMTWDMVSNELAATFLVLAVRRRQSLVGGGNVPIVLQSMRLTPGKERSIYEPMEQALKIYEQSGNLQQAAAVHYQLALTNSKLWTCQRDETKTRQKLSAAFSHYNMAFTYYSSSLQGNEPTFVLLCIDLASLYSSVSAEEDCVTKALGCCLESNLAFAPNVVNGFQTRLSSAQFSDWGRKMNTLATSVEELVLKLVRSLAKLDQTKYKDLYRSALTAKMKPEVDDQNESTVLLSKVHHVLSVIRTKFQPLRHGDTDNS